MKGVSEIIAIILILMIVIALAALAYTWFSGIFSSLTSTAGTSVTQAANAMTTQFKIEAAKNTSATSVSATIRNIGTQSINLAQVAAYLSGSPIVIASGNTGTLAAGSVQTLTLTVPASPAVCGLTLTLTVGTGNTDTKAVSC